MTNEFDAIIAGGGLSGLSLAAALAGTSWRDRSVLIVDNASQPAATGWGFWSCRPGPLDAAISRSFRSLQIHANGMSRRLALEPYQYHVVRREDLNSAVRALLSGCPGFQFRTGTVTGIAQRTDDQEGVTVTIDGSRTTASWVFDSVTRARTQQRPPEASLACYGWQVRCDRPVFDPDTPVLFDFRIPQPSGPRFGYVLPSDSRQALVEITEFVPRHGCPPQPAELREALARYLATVVGAAEYQVSGTETAVLPLRAHPAGQPALRAAQPATGRIRTIGSGAGMIKASTGYAFQRIQADSSAIAAALAGHSHPFSPPQPHRRHRFMDSVLLEVLRKEPHQIEVAFARMFSALPVPLIMRFLDEESHILDDLRLAASLPPAPYLRALARIVAGRRTG